MAFSTAFQRNAFQNNAFQIAPSGVDQAPTVAGGIYGYGWYKDEPNPRYQELLAQRKRRQAKQRQEEEARRLVEEIAARIIEERRQAKLLAQQQADAEIARLLTDRQLRDAVQASMYGEAPPLQPDAMAAPGYDDEEEAIALLMLAQ